MSVLSQATQKKAEEALVKHGSISQADLDATKKLAQEKGASLFGALLEKKQIDNEQLTKAIAAANNVPYVKLDGQRINQEIMDLIPNDLAERYMAIPIGEMDGKVVVAMLDAQNLQAVDFLSNKIGRPIKVYMASEEGIRGIIAQYAQKIKKDVFSDLIEGQQAETAREAISADGKTGKRPNDKNKDIKVIVQDSPISKALTSILEFSANNRASDIHIEPLEKELKIRCRIDGVLAEIMTLPKEIEAPLVSRIKILSNLKIDEHRIPQDGQFTVQVGNKAIDLRISISPVVWGEQVVVRLLDKSGTTLNLEDMGYKGRALRTIRKGLEQPNGMILTSGPTGSGKSTSLYALIQEIKSDAINIVTLEDPVEYKMDGINQIQVNAQVGLTFASGLRSILRQDPDVVMVGEIRDKETAQLAVQAALTGHLVFSTLHTNSAAGILPRLLDMGIEPFLIASTVHTVIGQRLVRRITEKGSEKYESDKTETEAIKTALAGLLPESEDQVKAFSEDLGYESLPLAGQNAYTLLKGKDTPESPQGYKGRMGLYEVFGITDEIQELIIKRATSSEIQKVAQKQGMVTMRQDGYLKALEGKTSIAEVNRVAAAGDS